MPRHLFGELARTVDGSAELTKRNIIFEMVGKARSLYDNLQKSLSSLSSSSSQLSTSNTIPVILQQHSTLSLDLRSLLWSLGHMASSEIGIGVVLSVDPLLMEWCLDGVANCYYYNIRGTFFHVLGLISRSSIGNKKLGRLGWDASDIYSNTAVTVPRLSSALFGKSSPSSSVSNAFSLASPILDGSPSASGNTTTPSMRKTAIALSRLSVQQAPPLPFMNNLTVPSSIKGLTPYIPSSTLSIEQEILNTILKVRFMSFFFVLFLIRLSFLSFGGGFLLFLQFFL
jgi:hypothetical protein